VPPSDADTIRAVEQAGFHYERCERTARYRLVRVGKRPLTFDEVKKMARDLLPPTPGGPRSTGIGMCECGSANVLGPDRPLCLSISYRDGDLDPPTIAALVSRRVEAMSLGDATVRVRVDLYAKPEPRCLPGDPGCGPIPLGQRCIAETGYVPGKPRTLVYDKRFAGGPCAHDGECDSGECPSCITTRADPYISGDCFFPSDMKPNAYCGCVAGQCAFFVQGP